VKTEQAEELDDITATRENCVKEVSDLNILVGELDARQFKENAVAIRQNTRKMNVDRRRFDDARSSEVETSNEVARLQNERASLVQQVAGEMDDRIKAIDVMIKAVFIVCERFNRFKNTEQCRGIKAQPDVEEPQFYKTRDFEEAREETIQTHVLPEGAPLSEAPVWLTRWTNRLNDDIRKEGQDDPEGLLQQYKNDLIVKPPSSSRSLGKESLIQLATEDRLVDAEMESEKSEMLAEATELQKIQKMFLDVKLPTYLDRPVKEILTSLGKGSGVGLGEGDGAGARKTMLVVLLSVLHEVRQEQAVSVQELIEKLDVYYNQIWGLVNNMIQVRNLEQKELDMGLNAAKNDNLSLMRDTEKARLDQLRAEEVRTSTEDKCKLADEEYAARETVRLEDLENVARLKSILRSLYAKAFPKACPRHNRVQCSSEEHGMCIYVKDTEADGPEQRCSCNPEFFGDACQYTKCGGFGPLSILYTDTAEGTCSNRGKCDRVTGECTCHPGYLHGPKQACDYKFAPPSKNGKQDNKCSEGRGAYDGQRGRCDCQDKYFGPGCEEMKCPNENGILYPAISGASCTSRGVCDTKTGECTCDTIGGQSYAHGEQKACEAGTCVENCRGRGICDPVSMQCACDEGYWGEYCQFKYCPNGNQHGCSNTNGVCDRLTGQCICKAGFSGIICHQTQRCQATGLFTDNLNWWTVWDKPGWVTCPQGQLLYKLKRSTCVTTTTVDGKPASTGGALSCIESGACAAPCEGDGDPAATFATGVLEVKHCYHQLQWYNTFDYAGWSKCQSNYYIAGLYRSCESLYCLNMVKCCSLKGELRPNPTSLWGHVVGGMTRWVNCGIVPWEFDGSNAGALEGTVPTNGFITGFKRGQANTLASIEAASYCGFQRGF